MLVISGRRAENRNRDGNFLHVGIATRAFERRFELADFVRVTSAELRDGLLSIDLVREIPEAMKSRKIDIGSGEAPTLQAEPKPAGTEARAEADQAAARVGGDSGKILVQPLSTPAAG
jgi:molecular chaperone IbpA